MTDRGAAGTAARPATAGRGRAPDSLVRPLAVTGAVAVVLAAAWLAAPPMGGDLSAQIAHADFARDHPLTPVDLRWFGGTLPLGYSLYVPWLGAWLGVRLLGALAAVAGSLLTATLFVRVRARRPAVGGALAAVCQVADLTEGRVAFAVGLAAALAAVLPLTRPARGPRWTGGRPLAGLAALLAALGSPVAGLLLGVVALTLALHRRLGDAARLVVPAALGVALVSGLFGDGGPAVYDPVDAVRAAAVTTLVGVLAPRRFPLLRTGAAVGVVMVVLAYALPTPVGGNASRLGLLFAVPVVAAVVEWPAVRATLAVVLAAVLQAPVVLGTLTGAGAPATGPGYFSPVLDQVLARSPLTGRVEIPELTGHWEAAYAARRIPLARGWLRQADVALYGDVFYDHAPTAAGYRSFLQRSATQWVAVPRARLTFFGRREADLVARGLPYLRQVWTDADWTLYAVRDPVPVVASPGAAVSLGAAAVDFSAPARAVVTVRVRGFRWLSLATSDPRACLAVDGDTVTVRARTGGRYRVTSSLTGDRRRC